MAEPHPNIPHTNDGPINGDEKLVQTKDTDSSSGDVDNVEIADIPSANLMVIDKATERAVLRKLDYRIVPTIMWVYLMNMMDRGEYLFLPSAQMNSQKSKVELTTLSLVNIGNARLFHLERDLNLRGNQFQLAVSMLFVTYCVSSDTRDPRVTRRMLIT